MQAALYVRVSTEEQAEKGYSLASQLEACRKRASQMAAEIVAEFTDSRSGASLDRAGLNNLRNLVAQGTVDLVIIYDPDRLARNLSHQLLLTEEFERAGAKLDFVNFEWKNTPEGKLFYSLRGAIAEYEKEKIRERTARGRRQKARQGGIMSVPNAYGYEWDKSSKTLRIVDKEADTVRRIFDLYVNYGKGSEQICRYLASEGVPPKKSDCWHRGTVLRIIKNEMYCGVFYQNRRSSENGKKTYRPRNEWIPVPVPSIVSREIWEAAQRITVANRLNHIRNVRHDYLLSGILYCWCGSRMSAGQTSNQRIRYYACQRKFPWRHPVGKSIDESASGCPSRYVRQDQADQIVWARLANRLANPDLFVAELRGRRLDPCEIQRTESRVSEIESHIENARTRRFKIARLAVDDRITESEAEHLLRDEKTRISTLEVELHEAKATLVSLQHDFQSVATMYEVAKDLSRRMSTPETLTSEQKRRLVRLLIERVVVQQNGDLIVYGAFPVDPDGLTDVCPRYTLEGNGGPQGQPRTDPGGLSG